MYERIVVISDHMLEGDLAVPPDAKAIIIFAHGAGSSRLSTRNRYVAQVLNDAGFATLLVDVLTAEEKKIDEQSRHLRFDIDLLANRILAVTAWVAKEPETAALKIGYFGSSTGAAAALISAAKLSDAVKAIVSRGGRPDLAGHQVLSCVTSPVLFIVGSNDSGVLGITAEAIRQLLHSRRKELVVIPGAGHLFEERGKMEQVAEVAVKWFESYLLERGTFENNYNQKAAVLSLRERFRIKVRFKDRASAGAMFASVLRKYGKENVVVIGIPRGGVVVADVIASTLHCGLDLVFPRKLRAQDNPEASLGAVMQDGSVYLDDDLIETLRVSAEYLKLEKSRQQDEIRRTISLYRPGSARYDIDSKTVILCDDGAATGSTVITAARWIRKQNPRMLIIAIPVASKGAVSLLKNEADHVEVLQTPSNFETVAQFYRDYSDVTDEQVVRIMSKYHAH